MMRKKFVLPALLLLPILCLYVWVMVLQIGISSGKQVFVRITGYDPRHLLAGHYILYRLDWENTDCEQFSNGICPKEVFEKYDMNIGRFYVQEDKAKELEKEIAEKDNVAEIVFSYREGSMPYVVNLLVNGKSWNKK